MAFVEVFVGPHAPEVWDQSVADKGPSGKLFQTNVVAKLDRRNLWFCQGQTVFSWFLGVALRKVGSLFSSGFPN